MVLRATNQRIEVLGPGSGTLRVTKQLVEALGPGSGTLRVTNQLVEVLVTIDPTVSVESVLSFEQDFYGVTLVDDKLVVTSDLDLQQTIHLDGYEWVESTLNITHDPVWSGFHRQNILHQLNIQSTPKRGVFYLSVESTLELDQNLYHYAPIEASVEHTLDLSHSILIRNPITSVLVINQSILYGLGYSFAEPHKLDFIQTIVISGDIPRSVETDSNINQSAAFYNDSYCVDKQYSPFIGESSTTIDPPPSELPFIQDENKQFRLDYPALGEATDTIILRHPELDNIDRVSSNRINRETRGGELRIYADPIWPKIHEIAVTFVGLSESDAQSLQDFIINYLGEDILLTDWEGREWIGIITVPDEPIVQNNDENWSASFTFEGELLDSCTPDSGLHIDHTLHGLTDWVPGRFIDILEIEHIIHGLTDWVPGSLTNEIEIEQEVNYAIT